MPRALPTKDAAPSVGIAAVGIDVGGERKGFHAVALTDGHYSSQLATTDERALARWCRETVRARVIAIDAPCGWSHDGHARPAERRLMQNGIACFSTPTREQAVGHRTQYFGWMLRGEALFRALEADFPICRQLPVAGQQCSFETFPHAIAWHLRGGHADASQKRTQRRDLLRQVGIDHLTLTNIDLIDAALCAYAAARVATGGECVSYGEPSTGLIIVPAHAALTAAAQPASRPPF